MSARSRNLENLCRCLRGAAPKAPDWASIIALANQTMTTPALIDFVRRPDLHTPEDVRIYVEELHRRNVMRNERLFTQLEEAVCELNEIGITPVLLKGATVLAANRIDRSGRRLICDLDLLVQPGEAAAAVKRLSGIGYRVDHEAPAGGSKWWADLARDSDVGMIDLQVAPPGPTSFYRALGEIRSHCDVVAVGRAVAYAPSPVSHAYLLMVHDQFQDQSYWIGDIDLRHLLDLRHLIAAPEGFDWNELAKLVSGELARNGLETLLADFDTLLAGGAPPEFRRRLIPRLQHRRRLLQQRFPLLRTLLMGIAIFDLAHYRREFGTSGFVANLRLSSLKPPRWETLRFFLALSRAQRAGKI